MKKYILLVATFALLITSATAQNVKELQKMRAMLPKTPPGFLSKSEKLKLILSPGFKKPASIQKFSSQATIDDATSTLSFLSPQTDIFSLEYEQPIYAAFDGVDFSTNSNSGLDFYMLNNQKNQTIYLFEVNCFIAPKNPQESDFNIVFTVKTSYETQTVNAQLDGNHYTIFFTFILQNSDNITITCSDPYVASWIFMNSQITKVTQ